MASEAELERLYQEFVLRGGGAFTLSNVNTTPAQYYNTISGNTLINGVLRVSTKIINATIDIINYSSISSIYRIRFEKRIISIF